MARTESASRVVSLVDKVTGPARAIAESVNRIGGAARGVSGTLTDRLERSLATNQRQLDQLRGRMVDAAASGWALQKALSAPINAAMNFESAMADVTKVVDFGGAAGIKAFQKDLLDLSARLPVAVTGLAEIAAAAGQAGIAGDELVKFTEGAAKIGVAFDIAAGTAGDAMAKLRTGLGMSTDQVFLLADAMNELSNRQASSASDILDFTTRVGPMAKMFGFGAEQAAAFGSAMISAGAAPDVAATSFANMGRALTKGVAATKAQREAYKALGLDAKKVATAMQKDAVGTTLNVMERIAKLPADRRASIVSQLFGDEARALGPLLTNLTLLRDSLGIVGDQANYAGSATDEYLKRSQTAANAVQLFWNRLDRLSISIGNALLPAMTSLMESVTPLVDRISDLAAAYPRVTTAVVGAAAGLVAFRVAAIGASFAAGMLRAGALTAAIVGMRGLGAAAAVASLALTPLRAALAGAQAAMIGFALATKVGGIGTALSVLASSALALVNPLNLAAGAVRLLGVALRVAFIGSGVGAVIAAIGAAGVFIYENWSGIGEMFTSFGKSFMEAIGPARPMVEGFAAGISTIWDKITGLLGPLDEGGAKWRAWGEALGAAAAGGVQKLIGALESVVGWMNTAIDYAGRAAAAVSNFFSSGGADTPPARSSTGPSGIGDSASKTDTGAVPSTPVDGARASGGSVYAGGTYRVNEFGQEFFTPAQDGTVHPAGRSPSIQPIFSPAAQNAAATAPAVPAAPAPVSNVRSIGSVTFHIHGSDGEGIAQDVMTQLSGVFGDYGLDL